MSEETKTASQEIQTVKRGRGRPKGSKNKAKTAQVAPVAAPVQA
jgi:hypothetical protein